MLREHFRFVRAVCAPSFALAFVACGGSTSSPAGGSATVTGTLDGEPFLAASEVGLLLQSNATTCITGIDGGDLCTTTSAGQIAGVSITNRGDVTCALVVSSAQSGGTLELASFEALTMEVVSQAGTVSPGTYSLVAAGGSANATAYVNAASSTCVQSPQVEATGGTITITQISSARIAGSYAITFGAQGSFSGSFDVDVCALPEAGTATLDAGPAVCTP